MSGDDPARSFPESDFRMWVNRPRGNTLHRAGVVVKSGAQVMKTVELSHYGNLETTEVRKRELRCRTFDKRQSSNIDFDTADPKNTWFCENDEIERLLAFLHSDVARTGRYQVVDTNSPGAALLELLETNEVNAQALVDALVRNCNVEQIVSLLANNDLGLSAAQSAVVGRRRELVARLRQLVDNPASTETQVQKLIGNAYWIFGGRYVGVAERRSLMMLDQYDIPLLGSDGTLHIVELKGPSIEHLITWHRNHWITGPEVHRAASQAMSYLRSLDEDGLGLSKKFENELGQHYDMSRVFATVVIGHSARHRPARAAKMSLHARCASTTPVSTGSRSLPTTISSTAQSELLPSRTTPRTPCRQPHNQPMTLGDRPLARTPGARRRQRRVGTTSRHSRRQAGTFLAMRHSLAASGTKTFGREAQLP